MNRYAKAIVAGLSVAIAAAIPLVGDGSTSLQDILIILGAGLAGAFPTWAVPNEPTNQDGAVEPGSLALGLLLGIVVAYLVLR